MSTCLKLGLYYIFTGYFDEHSNPMEFKEKPTLETVPNQHLIGYQNVTKDKPEEHALWVTDATGAIRRVDQKDNANPRQPY